ncbi:hypothetical protein KS4_10050 [Poriferisphaera corsica]|uniref:Uncharacterized protein n=1 Tax=Poriferisphaera corsica TaxID=2528020 RepID=A0A517YRX5_9BACT|nr:hypothetical protein [Poriferisphaera corsica]QDU32966.1 hypothetical protein KS4_10050 [Poriferisphaera corsica]
MANLKTKHRKNQSAVVFHTYPKLIFVWPLIAAGYIFFPFASIESLLPTLGWAYLLICLLVTLTISVDVERNHTAFWAVIFIAFFFLGMWLQRYESFTLFGNLFKFFASLGVTYSSGFAIALSILLTPPYLVMFIWSRLQHRWRITHNEFEHIAWGRADDSLARGAKRVRSTYPDILELLTLGAGTLIVYSATGRSELRRIPHVPMLFLLRRKIDRLLETTSVTDYSREDILAAEESETEDVEFNDQTNDGSDATNNNDPL